MLSTNEKTLLKHFGLADLEDHLDPMSLYRIMVERAFLSNDQTPFAAALRRGYAALKTGREPYRLSEAYEALIFVEGE